MTDEQIDAIASRMYVPIGFDGHPSQYAAWCREFAREVLCADYNQRKPSASDLPIGTMVARGGCTETKWNERRNTMMDGEYLLYAARVTR